MGTKPKRFAIDRSVMVRLEQELRDRAVSEGADLFPELSEISKQTTIEDIDIDEGSLEVRQDNKGRLHVAGVVNVYVTLNYGDSRDSTSFSDSYPGHFSALISGPEIKFDNTSVDTSSFFQ